ncbi:MAG: hypothetical protein IJL26_07640 [Clostridia bacterium]|nr:hypothetical protein [Clostridia bacterium]
MTATDSNRTLLDFFTRTTSDVKADITSLYPMVAALSEGQRAGIEFISLRKLVMLGNREAEYADDALEDLEPTSVYEGVDRGIHMFGSDSAFNLNSKLYDWNQNAKSVFVYFKVDETAPVSDASTSASAFSAGRIAVAAVGGACLGALVTACFMSIVGKKKKNETAAA